MVSRSLPNLLHERLRRLKPLGFLEALSCFLRCHCVSPLRVIPRAFSALLKIGAISVSDFIGSSCPNVQGFAGCDAGDGSRIGSATISS
jgi:hypothetical protein